MKMGDTPVVAIYLYGHSIPGGGKVVFHSLLDGRPLRELEMSTPAFSFARCGTDLADFSGDGIDEYVVYYWAKGDRRHTLACYSADTLLWEFRL